MLPVGNNCTWLGLGAPASLANVTCTVTQVLSTDWSVCSKRDQSLQTSLERSFFEHTDQYIAIEPYDRDR